jgi:hypothetical protein
VVAQGCVRFGAITRRGFLWNLTEETCLLDRQHSWLAVLRSRAKELGYDIYSVDDVRYVVAKRIGGARKPVLGENGGVTLYEIVRWLDGRHLAAQEPRQPTTIKRS